MEKNRCQNFIRTILLVSISVLSAQSQQADRYLLSTAGGILENQISLEFSIGETVAGDLVSGEQIENLYQGFIQNNEDIISATFDLIVLEGIAIFPNPTSDFISITSTNMDEANVSIFDLEGRSIITGIMKTGELLIDVQRVTTGMYTLMLQSEYGYATFKINVHR